MFQMMQRHQRLDEALRNEYARRWPDAGRIQQLKKMKLAIKDRLRAAMTARLRTATAD
jgi:hypothetical protein